MHRRRCRPINFDSPFLLSFLRFFHELLILIGILIVVITTIYTFADTEELVTHFVGLLCMTGEINQDKNTHKKTTSQKKGNLLSC